ncbi:hypothetical protein J6590_086099 [Homalodisca vitripennis]|nr:hypothetical protein J6590_086099 [Homalodisca vitripennis]
MVPGLPNSGEKPPSEVKCQAVLFCRYPEAISSAIILDFDNLTCDVEGIMSLKALTLARSARLDVEDVMVLKQNSWISNGKIFLQARLVIWVLTFDMLP